MQGIVETDPWEGNLASCQMWSEQEVYKFLV